MGWRDTAVNVSQKEGEQGGRTREGGARRAEENTLVGNLWATARAHSPWRGMASGAGDGLGVSGSVAQEEHALEALVDGEVDGRVAHQNLHVFGQDERKKEREET